MKIQESGENYLETILLLYKENGSVRSIDIANKLNFSKPSVSRAMSILKNADLITMDNNGYITLTKEGKIKAENIYERHKTITDFFVNTLNVDSDLAEKDACRIEHVISQETFEAIKSFIQSKK